MYRSQRACNLFGAHHDIAVNGKRCSGTLKNDQQATAAWLRINVGSVRGNSAVRAAGRSADAANRNAAGTLLLAPGT